MANTVNCLDVGGGGAGGTVRGQYGPPRILPAASLEPSQEPLQEPVLEGPAGIDLGDPRKGAFVEDVQYHAVCSFQGGVQGGTSATSLYDFWHSPSISHARRAGSQGSQDTASGGSSPTQRTRDPALPPPGYARRDTSDTRQKETTRQARGLEQAS